MSTTVRLLTLTSLLAACVTGDESFDHELDDGQGDTAENFSDSFIHDSVLGLESFTAVFTGNPEKPRFTGLRFIADEGDMVDITAHGDPELSVPTVKPDAMLWILDDNFKVLGKNDNANASTLDARVRMTLPASPNRQYFMMVRDHNAGTPEFDNEITDSSVGVGIRINWEVTVPEVHCTLSAPDQTPQSQGINWVLTTRGGSLCTLTFMDGTRSVTQFIGCNDSFDQIRANRGINKGVVRVEGVDDSITSCELDVEITR